MFAPRCRTLTARVGICADFGHARGGAVDEMKAAMTGIVSALGRRKFLASAGAFAALAALIAACSAATRWRRTPASAPACNRPSLSAMVRAGSRPQPSVSAPSSRALTASARSLGCENRKFLFFGSDPPPQCGQLNGQIARMQANLADLRGARRRRSGRSHRPLQRGMPQCAGETQPISSRRCSAASRGSRFRQPQTDARVEPLDRGEGPPQPSRAARREGGSRGACRLLRGLRAHLRRQLLSRFLYGRRKPRRQPGGGLQGLVPQRRRGALLVSVWRNDRRGRVVFERRALCEFAERRQIPANLRSELLLPAQGAKLGGRARRRGGEVRPREARYHGDAGEIGGNGAPDH